MFFYIILFLVVGLVIGFIVKNNILAMLIITAISVIWISVWGSWAVATFAELIVGFTIARTMTSKEKD